MLRWFFQPLLLCLVAASFGAIAEPTAAGYDQYFHAVATACDAQVEDLQQHDAPPPGLAAPAPAVVRARTPVPDTLQVAAADAGVGYSSRAPPTALQ